MPISQVIADLAGALDAARAQLTDVLARIEALQVERRLVVQARPHTDDIVAVFTRGLASASSDFERQFATHLSATFGGDEGAAAASKARYANLLRLEGQADRETRLNALKAKGGWQPELNIEALTYFLRDQIAAEIPALVDKLCPAARNGMKAADRERALQDIDAKLATLSEERDMIQADLAAARMTVNR